MAEVLLQAILYRTQQLNDIYFPWDSGYFRPRFQSRRCCECHGANTYTSIDELQYVYQCRAFNLVLFSCTYSVIYMYAPRAVTYTRFVGLTFKKLTMNYNFAEILFIVVCHLLSCPGIKPDLCSKKDLAPHHNTS